MPHPCSLMPEDPSCVQLALDVAQCKIGLWECLQTGNWELLDMFLFGTYWDWTWAWLWPW